MKKLTILLPLLLLPQLVNAAELNENSEKYIAALCSLTAQESSAGTKAGYVSQIKAQTARGESPSSLDKPDFDEDEAEKVVTAYLNQPKAHQQNPERCQATTRDAYKQAE